MLSKEKLGQYYDSETSAYCSVVEDNCDELVMLAKSHLEALAEYDKAIGIEESK